MSARTIVSASILGLAACTHAGGDAPSAARSTRERVALDTHGSKSPTTWMPWRAAPIPIGDTSSASPLVLADVAGRHVVYVADEDDGRLCALDAQTFDVISSLEVGGSPASLVMTKDGRRVVALRDTNEVIVVAGAGTPGDPMRVVLRTKTAAEPLGLALTPDDETLLVASGWGHAVSAFSAATLARKFEIDVGREPRAVVVSDDGRRAFVSHAIGSRLDVIDINEARPQRGVSLNASESFTPFRTENFEVSLEAGQGYSLARSVAPEGRIFAPHARVRPVLVRSDVQPVGYGTTEFGPTEEFDVAVVDEDDGTALARSIDTQGGITCTLPRAAAATAGGELLVACLGTNEVVAFDAAAVNPHEAVLRRWKVAGGPVGIAVDEAGGRALVWSAFAHAITVLALAGEGSVGVAISSTELPRARALAPAFAVGRALFHTSDARISEDGRACASCHPDGRDDGLVWSTPDGPRNPPMLAGRLDGAAPYGWLGSSKDVTTHMTKTFARLGGKGVTAMEKDALAIYLDAMKAPVSAPPPDAALVDEGRLVFTSEKAACSRCHGDDGASVDTLTHNVGSWANGDVRGVFDTPSLHLVGGTAPYFHDGRYASLRALLTHVDGTMGRTKHLAPRELDALEAYVRSL